MNMEENIRRVSKILSEGSDFVGKEIDSIRSGLKAVGMEVSESIEKIGEELKTP